MAYYMNAEGTVLHDGQFELNYWLDAIGANGEKSVRIIGNKGFSSEEELTKFKQTELKAFLDKLGMVLVP